MYKFCFLYNTTCFCICICKDNIYFLKDRKAERQDVSSCVYRDGWARPYKDHFQIRLKHPGTMEISPKMKSLQRPHAWNFVFVFITLSKWAENPICNKERDGMEPLFFLEFRPIFSLLLHLQLSGENHLISWANRIINGKQCWAPVDLYSLINSYLLLRGHSLVNIAE